MKNKENINFFHLNNLTTNLANLEIDDKFNYLNLKEETNKIENNYISASYSYIKIYDYNLYLIYSVFKLKFKI